jgi:hypothetical protein
MRKIYTIPYLLVLGIQYTIIVYIQLRIQLGIQLGIQLM